MKKFLTVLLLTLGGLSAMAQSKFNVSGAVAEKGTNEAVVSATVRILSLPDSAMVGGAATSATGTFTVKDVKKGKYAIKVTYIGYQDEIIPLDLTNKKTKEVNVGNILISPDAKVLKEAKVTAAVAKVQVSGDSIIYNADAYRVAEGSALQDLVKQMPGAEVDDEGNIKINGKTVKKIMMNGKEFFDNDTKVAMQNIPTDIIDKIKTYDRKSDFSRVTGIDDGEEETVLDLTVKKGMNKGFTGNAQFGVGTENRYNGRLFGMGTLEDAQIQLIGGMNNVGDRGFGGGGGRGGFGFGGGGLRASKNLGINFGTAGDKLETGGNVRLRYDGSDSESWTSTHNFTSVSGDFQNSHSKSLSSNIGINMNFRLEWKPDSMTNIIFRPAANYSRNRGMSKSEQATFNDNPDNYFDLYEGNIFGNIDKLTAIDSLVVNTNISRQQTFSTNKGLNGELQLNRRLNNDGRNITLRATGSVSESESENLSASNVKYYLKSMPGDINNRYTTTPGRNRSYSAQLTYSEPIAFRTYLQFSYRFNYSYSMNDRQTNAYLSDPTTYNALYEALGNYRYNIDGAVDYMLATLGQRNDSIVPNLSQYSEYNNYNHNIQISFRKVTDLYNLSAGIDLLPQNSVLNYKGNNITELTEVKRSVFNFAPHLDLRVNFDKQTQLRLNYRSNTSQPSMTSLLNIEDDSDPLNKTKGNTNLKPSFSHNFGGNFNTFDMEHQRSIFVFFNAGLTQNAFAQRTSYDTETGKRITKQENINGNWNGMLGFGFNTALDSEKYLTLNTMTNGMYNHQVSYLDPMQYAEEKSATNSMNLMENLSLSYRKDWFQMSLNGNVNYQHSRNNVMNNNNLDTWTFSYGTEVNLMFDNGFSLSTDIAENSRRGFSQKEMNTNELIWNAQISKSFLKGNALTITAQWNDILGNRSNISRTINAMMSRDSRTNAIYSYGMITAIYKLNIFGGANTQGGSRGQWGGRGGFPGGGMPMGGFGGGFGGGRPRM